VIDQIDAEMGARQAEVRSCAETRWQSLIDESIAYIEMALEPEIQHIMLLNGLAVLGDPSRWPNQNSCLRTTAETMQALIDEGTVKPVDAEAAARLLNGAALNAALWIAAADDPPAVLSKAVEAFRHLVSGLLQPRR
jgi:hypothetical protein